MVGCLSGVLCAYTDTFTYTQFIPSYPSVHTSIYVFSAYLEPITNLAMCAPVCVYSSVGGWIVGETLLLNGCGSSGVGTPS